MKKLIVAGSEGRLGSFISKKFVDSGHEILGIDIAQPEKNPGYPYFKLDLSTSASAKLLSDQLHKTKFTPNGIVYCVGITGDNAFSWSDSPEKITDEEFYKSFAANSLSLNYLIDGVMRYLSSSPDTVPIVVISSIYGNKTHLKKLYDSSEICLPLLYGPTKAALQHLAFNLQNYYANRVRINVVAPGGILSESMDSKFIKEYLDRTLSKSFVESMDVYSLCEFLVSEKSRQIFGQIISLDGGLRLG